MTQRKRTPLIRDLYIPALQRVMDENRIARLTIAPSHLVGADASFNDVVRNTAWYCWLADSQPYYRYRRYLEVLQRIKLPSGDYRVVHLDIGCGAGLFSWALLDWARNSHLEYGRVALYGFDHSPEMVNLAHWMRNQFTQSLPDYPDLRYTCDDATLLRDLTEQHQNGTIYVISFGHVLAQAQDYDPGEIAHFAHVINHIVEMDARPRSVLVAVDAKGWAGTFASGWSALITNLTVLDIEHKMFSVQSTPINDDNRAKIAVLSRAARQGG